MIGTDLLDLPPFPDIRTKFDWHKAQTLWLIELHERRRQLDPEAKSYCERPDLYLREIEAFSQFVSNRVREKSREREEARRTKEAARVARLRIKRLDRIVEWAEDIRIQYPSMPVGLERKIAEHACEFGSGRIGDHDDEWYDDTEVDYTRAAVVAHIRHSRTPYDRLLDEMRNIGNADDKDMARDEIRDIVNEIIELWENDLAIASEEDYV